MVTVEFDRLTVKPGFKILDIGCGSGRHTGAAYQCRNVTAIGVDLNFDDLKEARGRLQLHDRLGEHGIPVIEIAPGIIETPMTAVVKEKYDKLIAGGLLVNRRWGQPEDVAAVVSAFARGDLDYCTGQTIEVGGGFGLRRL